MFSRIWSTELTDYVSETQEDGQSYLEIKKVNFFVGANNSGKSRLIHRLMGLNTNTLLVGSHQHDEKFIKILDAYASFSKTHDLPSFYHPIAAMLDNCLDDHEKYKEKINLCLRRVKNIQYYTTKKDDKFCQYLLELGCEIDEIKIRKDLDFLEKKYYIPTLRGLRPLIDNKDIYNERTIKDYFKSQEPRANFKVATGHDIYKQIQMLILGTPEGRTMMECYTKELSNKFFYGETISIIPEYGKDTLSVKIGDEPQLTIYDQGDGLQQIIIITSATYLETEPSMFFIEEPEINLHPGMLRKLIHFLIDHTPHQYFITTHSNHLIDFYNYSDQVTVHRLKKKVENGQTTFTIHDCKQDKDLLQELGVLNTSVYLANSTIWVEGITDRLYLKAYMQKYLAEHPEKQTWQNYSEHIHYAFVEYQGGTLGHWDFNDDEANDSLKALKLCATPFLIADGDIRSKGNRYQTLIEQLGDNFFITKGKEFENMLPEAILKETAKHFFHNSRKAKNLQPHNLETINYSDYFGSQEGIGKYLDDLIGITNNVFSEDSGTIRRKLEFCTKACEYMTKKDENTRDYANQWKLTDELKELCEKIFTHIERCNN